MQGAVATDRASFTPGKVDIDPRGFAGEPAGYALESADLDPYLVMDDVGVCASGRGQIHTCRHSRLTTTATIDGDKVAVRQLYRRRAAGNDFTGAMTAIIAERDGVGRTH